MTEWHRIPPCIRVVLPLIALALTLAACGAPNSGSTRAEPATTAGTPTRGWPPSPSGVSPPATPPNARLPEQDRPGPAGIATPPASTLTFGSQTQTGGFGTYCWATACVAKVGIPIPDETLLVPAGSGLVFTFGGTSPPSGLTATAYALADQPRHEAGGQRWLPLGLPSGGPGAAARAAPPRGIVLPVSPAGLWAEITAEVPAGEYVIFIRLRGSGPAEADASYGFHIVVQ